MAETDRRKHDAAGDLLSSARFVAVDQLIERHRAEYLELLADELDKRTPQPPS